MAIAEECRDRDQEIGEERLRLLHIIPQECMIFGEGLFARDLHAPGDPAGNRGALIHGKVVTDPDAKMGENPPQHFLVGVGSRGRTALTVPQQLPELPGQVADGKHEIGDFRRDGTAAARRHRHEYSDYALEQ